MEDQNSDQHLMHSKEKPRKISPEQVEIVGAEGSSPKNPFEGTPFAFKKIKMVSSGPFLFLIPLLLPLILLFMILMVIPLLLFGKKFVIKRP